MPSLVPGCEYDIFISYRQKDNKGDHWVTGFVDALRTELDATFKEDISIFFDENPHDGLHENYDVDDSLREKLKCAIFLPIVSRTYCDSQSFAWEHELKAFISRATSDSYGVKVKLSNGNTTSRLLPVRIHELEDGDTKLFESETHSVFRSIDFVFKSSGVNRPLLPSDKKEDNQGHVAYRDQVNKVANAIREIVVAMQKPGTTTAEPARLTHAKATVDSSRNRAGLKAFVAAFLVALLVSIGYVLWKNSNDLKDPKESGLAILVIRNNTGDAGLDYYGQSLASEIRTRISMSKQFQFISGLQAVLPYTNGQKTTREIGEALNVDFILSGLYQKAGNKIKIELELVDAATGKLVWPLSLERDMKDIQEGRADIALDILNRFTDNSSSIATTSTVSLEAKTKNAKGFEIFYRGGAADSGAFQGMSLFKEAIALDSSYIDAWINLMEAEGFAYLNDWIDSKDNLDRYLAYIDTHFPGTWQRDLAHGIYAYKVSHKYDESETYLNKVLASDPQNIIALGNLSFVYKRKLDFKNTLLLKQKRLMIDPGNAGEWKDLGDVFRLMGDYKNALKATLKASELSGAQFLRNLAVYTSVWGNLPLEQLPADVKSRASTHFGIVNSSVKGDWKEVTRRALSSKTYIWICTSYGQRGMRDSARYWGNFAIKNANDGFRARYLAFAGNREKALEAIEEEYREELETGDDKMLFCYRQIDRIHVLIILGEYAEATKELKQLNEDFPEFGDYGPFSAPWFQKVGEDYPPFQEALDNLKLRKSAELEQIIKF